jgi:hypothetical protein
VISGKLFLTPKLKTLNEVFPTWAKRSKEGKVIKEDKVILVWGVCIPLRVLRVLCGFIKLSGEKR